MTDNKKEEYHFFAEEKRYDPNRFTLGPKVFGEEKSENFKSHNFVYLFVAIGFIFLFVFGFVLLSDYSKTTHQTSGVFYVISEVSNFGNGLFSSLTGKVVDESSQPSMDSSESTTSSSPEQTTESSSGAPEESPIEPATDSAQESLSDTASEEQIIEPPLPPIPELPTEETPTSNEQSASPVEENQTIEPSSEQTNETTSEENITVIDLEPVNENQTNVAGINQTIEFLTNDSFINDTVVEEKNITLENISTRVSTKQYGAVIGRAVKWEKKIVVEAEKESNQVINVDLPSIAGNVSVVRVDNETGLEEDITKNAIVENEKQIEEQKATISITGNVVADSGEGIITMFFGSLGLFFRNLLGMTGNAISNSSEDIVSVAVSETVSNNDQIVVEYYTEAPYAEEKIVADNQKDINIVGPDAVHYQEVLAYSDLPSETKDLSKIKLYWLTSDSGDVEEVSFSGLDNDGNGLYDAIEWVVPHLSNQSYRLIVITRAIHLDASRNYVSDIYGSVKAQDRNWSEIINSGEYVRVSFEKNLTLGNDMTIYARGNGVIKVLNENQDNSIGEFNISGEGEYKIYPNYGNSDVYDLLVLGSVEFDYIVDPSLITGVCPGGMMGAGNSSDPCEIYNWTQLNATRNNLTASYILMNNISSSDSGYSGLGNNWTPIGTLATPFTGNFNGNNNTISNLTINLPSTDYVGLFGRVQNAIINHVNLNSVNVTGDDFVGGLVGHLLGGTISSSYSTGNVVGAGSGLGNIGGLVGSADPGLITNSYSTASVLGINNVGGLVGNLNIGGSILNSYVMLSDSQNVYATSTNVGLVVGLYYEGTITSTYPTVYDSQFGNITFLDWNVGNSAGGNLLDYIYINNNSVTVDSATCPGCNVSANITLSGLSTTYTNPKIYKDGTIECNSTTTPACFNFTSLNAGTVRFNVSSWSNYSISGETPLFAGGTGTAGDPYQITTWTQLNNTKQNLTASYILMANLSSSDSDYSGLGDSWVPIGNSSDHFTGNFNGNGKTIYNLTINLPSTDYVGLFAYVGGNISNLNLNVDSIIGQNNIGGLVGKQTNGVISNSSFSGNVTGSSVVGGLIGDSLGIIINCSASGNIYSSGNSLGGLVGDSRATISNSFFSGNVNGSLYYVGGLVGRQVSGSITNSSSTGVIFSEYGVAGGLVGQAFGTITNSYSTANVTGFSYIGGLVGSSLGTITNSYSTGRVDGIDHLSVLGFDVGGFAGYQNSGTISNSSSIGSVSGSSYVGGFIGYQNGGTITNSSMSILDSQIISGSSNVSLFAGLKLGNITGAYATVYNSQYGNITFLDWNVSVTNGGNLLDYITIGNNFVFVNVTNRLGLNKSANITFYNNVYHGQYPLRLLNMGKGGVPCNSTFGCNNFTSLTASTVRLNVTDFGNGEIMVGKVLRSQFNVSLSTGWNMISLQMNGSSAGDKIVPLSHGWNLIGVSNDAGISYTDINYTNSSGDSMSMLVASRNGHLQKQFAYLEADGNGIKRYNYAPLETSTLTKGKGYWVYVNDADGGNLTLPGAGGNSLGESYSLSDLTFTNGTDEMNISEAVSEGWVGGGDINDVFWYWDSTYSYIDEETLEEVLSPRWERVGTNNEGSLSSWDGYFIRGLRSNITLLRQD